jgi:site-specific recombinase XerC
LVDEWVTAIGLRREDYGTHSRRRTKASTIYKATGNLRAIQILLGHTKIENTVRYLGVDIEDALELAEKTEIENRRPQLTIGAARHHTRSLDSAETMLAAMRRHLRR